MNKLAFKERMKSLKSYREQNPDKGYWEWKQEVPTMQYAGEVPPEDTVSKNYYITQGNIADIAGYDKYGNLQIIANKDVDGWNFNTPNIVVTPQENASIVSDGRAVVKPLYDAATWVTPLGDAEEIYDVYNSLTKGNYGDAALAGVGFVLPGVIGKGWNKLTNKWRKIKRLPEVNTTPETQTRSVENQASSTSLNPIPQLESVNNLENVNDSENIRNRIVNFYNTHPLTGDDVTLDLAYPYSMFADYDQLNYADQRVVDLAALDFRDRVAGEARRIIANRTNHYRERYAELMGRINNLNEPVSVIDIRDFNNDAYDELASRKNQFTYDFSNDLDDAYRLQDQMSNSLVAAYRDRTDQILNLENRIPHDLNDFSTTISQPYDPENLPEDFLDPNVILNASGNIRSLSYFNLSPEEALLKAKSDFNRLGHGSLFDLAHDAATSTDSYPLSLSMMRRHRNEGKIIPIKDQDGNYRFHQLNHFGRTTKTNPKTGEQITLTNNDLLNKQIKSVEAFNKDLGLDLGLPYIQNGIIHVPSVVYRKYKNGGQITSYKDGGEINDDKNNTTVGGYTEEYWPKQSRLATYYDLDPTTRFSPEALLVDNQASGEENEYWKAYLGLDNMVPAMNKNAHTEWDEQIEKEKIENGELPSDFYGTTPSMDLSLQAAADTLMLGKINRNYDEYKAKYHNLPGKKTIQTIYENAKNVMNNPGKWQQMDGEYIIKKKNPEYDNEVNPLGMLAEYGMKWDPQTKTIYVHDTYDFPWYARAAGGIKNRPKEMKIRSAIKFDPKKGSVLLRTPENYNEAYQYQDGGEVNPYSRVNPYTGKPLSSGTEERRQKRQEKKNKKQTI